MENYLGRQEGVLSWDSKKVVPFFAALHSTSVTLPFLVKSASCLGNKVHYYMNFGFPFLLREFWWFPLHDCGSLKSGKNVKTIIILGRPLLDNWPEITAYLETENGVIIIKSCIRQDTHSYQL